MISYDKDQVCNFLKKLSNDITFHLEEMKVDFQKNPPSVNIKERFMVNRRYNFKSAMEIETSRFSQQLLTNIHTQR